MQKGGGNLNERKSDREDDDKQRSEAKDEDSARGVHKRDPAANRNDPGACPSFCTPRADRELAACPRAAGRTATSVTAARWVEITTDGLHHPEGARIIASTSGSISPRSELWRGGLTRQRPRGGRAAAFGGGEGHCWGRPGGPAPW